MEAVAKEKRRVAYTLVLTFAILASGIVVGGTFYYRNYKQQFRAVAEQQLSTIAKLKVDELVEYRKERSGDADTFFENAAFSGLVRRFLSHPEDAEAQQQIHEWAAKYVATGQYDLVRLLDAQGVIRLSVPAGRSPLSSAVAQRIPEVLRSGQVVLQDFHRNEHDQQIYLTLLVPISDEPEHNQALGVLVLRVNPETYLYPFIKRWPMPSETAETLLVRRDGKEVVFLNGLKFQTNAALTLHIPLAETDRPAVKAVLGQEGIVEGRDYRSVPVIAYVCAVPDSPWFMVARMDTAEVYAPLRERLWMIILLVSALVLCAGLGAGAIWRHQRVRFYKEQYQMAEALRESEERFGRVFVEGPIGMVMIDEKFRFIQVNPAFASMLGYSEKEMQTMAFTDITHPDYVQGNVKQMERLLRGELSVYSTEKQYIAKSGKELWGLVQVSVVRNAAGKFRYFFAIINNITARRVAEEALHHEQALMATLMESLPDAVYFKNTASRFVRVNPATARKSGMSVPAQMIGKTDKDFFTGEHADKALADEQEIMRTGEPLVNIEEKETWPDGSETWVLTTKLPLRDDTGQIIGTCGISSDITARKRADEALANERAILRALVDHLPAAIYLKDLAGRKTLANRLELDYVGATSEAEVLGKTDFDIFPPEQAERYRAYDQEVIRSGQPIINREGTFTKPDGSVVHLLGSTVPLRDAAGRVIGLAGINYDVTDRKRVEAALADERAFLRTLVNSLPLAVYLLDLDGRRTLANPLELDYLGAASEAEVLGKTAFDSFPPEMAAAYRADDMEVINTGRPVMNHEGSFTKPDGSVIWLLASKVPLRDSAGRITGLLGINYDITDRKRTEERLLKVITQTRCILYSGHVTGPKDWRKRALEPVSPFHWDTPVVNEQTAQKIVPLELAAGESYLQAWERSWYRADAAQMNWNSGNAFLNDLPFFRNEYRCTDKHGVGHWMQEFVTVQKLAENRWQIFSIAMDISDLKRVETELRESQALYHSLVDQMPAGVFRKDANGRFTFVNSEFCRLKEMTAEQFLGKTVVEVGLPDDELAARSASQHAIIMESGRTIEDDEVYTSTAGETRNYHAVKSPVFDSAGKIVGSQGVLFDITDRKRAEERLLKVVTQTRCILHSGQVEGPEGWRKRALEPDTPFRWNLPMLNKETAQEILPLEQAPGESYLEAWVRSRNRADIVQMNWNSGNAFLNDLPFYRNEFRCTDKHGVVHWMQEMVTVQKLAEDRWEVFSITTDITDLKKVETELRESQALYHSLVDQMSAGVFRKDANGRFTFVNSEFCRLKEMTAEQFLGKTVMEVGLPDGELAARSASQHEAIMQGGKPIEDEEIYTSTTGETRNYHAVKSPVFGSAGKVVGTQGVLFDITDRKRAEQALEQAFQRQKGISWLHENLLASPPLRDKLQLITETIVRLFDADFCRIWLARPGDLCEQGCMHAAVTEGPHACRHREVCLHLLASAGRYTHLDGAKHRRVPYGAYKIGLIASGKETKFLINDVQQNSQVHDRQWAKELGLVSFAGYRLQSPGGAPLGVLALFAKRPLTLQEDVLLEGLSNATTSVLLTHLAEDETRRELAERKRAEEALHWSETQLQVTLESTADGILAVDSKGKVIKANKRFAELWRIPQSVMDTGDDQALLKFVVKQLSDPDAFLKKVQSLYNSDAVEMDTLTFKDGRIFERYTAPMMMAGAVIGRVWSFRDITGRKRQEKELSDKNAELERFTYTVSHDLKSPLVTVKTFLGYLEQDLTRPDKERIKQDVGYMHTAADKMSLLLDELLNLARVGRKMNPAERVTFKEIAQEVVRLVAGRISTGGAEVQVADADVVLEGDRPRLMEIWQNLVENACKFMGNQPKPRVEIGVEKHGSEIIFFVRDNGMGIDPRYQAKVFGLFEKLDPKGEGTGMGLALVKRIVDLYEGRIWVESAGLGQGAKFLFTLPGAVIIEPEQSP